ncbi:MAG: acyltransferase [Proteobacteria bacterium]|nr:acyltransferase [Pseudomonadota bacterium]
MARPARDARRGEIPRAPAAGARGAHRAARGRRARALRGARRRHRVRARHAGVCVVSEHWQQRPEGGGHFAIWLIRTIGLYCGRTFARLFLYPITLYFYFRREPERRASFDYLQRVFGRPANAWQVMKLIHAFACTILDRVFLLARGLKGFHVTTRGLEYLHAQLDAGRSVMLLGAHYGSFEAARVLATLRPQYRLRLVMDKSKMPALTEVLGALAPDLAANIIDAARGGTDVVLAISEAVREGSSMVAMLGDRGRAHEMMRQAPFLGEPAPFPVAPWLIASTLQLPVLLCLGTYRGGNRYELVFEPLAERVELPRGQREAALDAYIRGYAARLEHHVRDAPYNWFNFYDFWHSLPPDEAEHAAPAVAAGHAE